MAGKTSLGTAKASHSVRTTDAIWGRAKSRADGDGTNMNAVISELLEGYGNGMINLPKVTKTYGSVKAKK